ncbi:MAG TPA: hypothetical protein VNO50_15810 [Pyrinomonadaceae bacterium]|nr:hypothetical protein [Pyrinomonadaceae bacterium]
MSLLPRKTFQAFINYKDFVPGGTKIVRKAIQPSSTNSRFGQYSDYS